MLWVMNGFSSMDSNVTYTELQWKKQTNEKVMMNAAINNFTNHTETLCNCNMDPGKLNRLLDTNGRRKRTDTIDLFDLRPCYLECIKNLWDYHRFVSISTPTANTPNSPPNRYELEVHGNF